MSQPLSTPQAQLPFVDSEGRLLRPALTLVQGIITLIQGSGGILDTLSAMAGSMSASGSVQAIAALQDQMGLLANAAAAAARQADAPPPPQGPIQRPETLLRPNSPPALENTPPAPIPPPPGYAASFRFSSGVRLSSGIGVPNGLIWGSVGDIYVRQDGGSSTTLWVKESGSNTQAGWISK